mgnify:CR=1 FL=1
MAIIDNLLVQIWIGSLVAMVILGGNHIRVGGVADNLQPAAGGEYGAGLKSHRPVDGD